MTVEMRDAKRKLPAERHGELLARAVEISAAEGLSAVTLRRVATDLGVTPGLVSHYFSSAEQLITAAFRTAAVADMSEARSRVAAALTPTGQDGRADGLSARRVQRGRERALAGRVEPGSAQCPAGVRGQCADGRVAGMHRRHRSLWRRLRGVSCGRRRCRGAASVDHDRRTRCANGGAGRARPTKPSTSRGRISRPNSAWSTRNTIRDNRLTPRQ